jgi:ABC-type nitrate/sulfonate/bicarbonate transport system substrate-binding protein/pimeloyl-ACP methyl ester carboxylesterase
MKKMVTGTSLFLAAILQLGALTAASAEPLKIAIVSRTVFYVPVWIADRLGYFKEEGLEASIEVYDNAEKINEDLRSGKVHVAVSTPESVVVDAYKGGSLRLIAGNAEKLPHFIITKPEMKTLQQLKGARFGVLSMQEGTTYLVQEVAKAAGLTQGDYEILAVGGAPTRWRLLKEGKIDAGLQPFPLSYEAEAAGFNNLGPVAAYVPDYQFTSINIDSKWGAAHPQTVTAFLRAIRKGQAYIASHPRETAEIAAQELKTTVALTERALADTAKLKILSQDLSVSERGLATVFATLQAAGLVAAGDTFEMDRIVDHSYLKLSRDIQVRDVGSFFVGGKNTSLAGLPEKEIKYAADAPPMKVNPNGTYAYGQVYVQFTKLAAPARSLPVLFLNGGTSTGTMWDTTPDGRPGWNSIFLKSGYSTYLTDAVGKGRASWARFPEINKVEPTFRPNEETWTLLRFGPRYTPDPATREPFPNTQFPVSHFDEFAKQGVPRFAGQDAIELDAYRTLIQRICPCVIVAQSSGAYFAAQLAAEKPELIRAIVAVEMTAAPDLAKLSPEALGKVPQLILWGDNWQQSPFWQRIHTAVDKYATDLRAKGGKIEVVDLPTRGIAGNTHQMMMDRNNLQIAEIALNWLGQLPVDQAR